jgi:hypothetical protein
MLKKGAGLAVQSDAGSSGEHFFGAFSRIFNWSTSYSLEYQGRLDAPVKPELAGHSAHH